MEKKYTQLGKLSWLWMNSPLHANWSLDLLRTFVLPPIELGQYILLERAGLPVAYCSWAYLNAETEMYYILDPSKVRDWQVGDRLWFIDWVAPFSKQDSWNLRKCLLEKFPNSLARAIRVKQKNQRGRVMEFKGRAVDSQRAKNLFAKYYQDFIHHTQALGYRTSKG